MRIKELAQLVAAWQCSLRLSNVQSCYATLEYSLRNICSNKFGIYSQPIFQTFGLPAHSPLLLCSNLRQPFESSRVSRSATFVKNRGRSDIRKQNFRRRGQPKENFCTFAPRRAQKLFGHIKQHTNLHQYISVSSIYVPYHRIISTNWEGPNVDVIIVQNN